MLVSVSMASVPEDKVCPDCSDTGPCDYVIATEHLYPDGGDGCIPIMEDGVEIGEFCWELNWDGSEAMSLDWWVTCGTFSGEICIKGGPDYEIYEFSGSSGSVDLTSPDPQNAISHFAFCGCFTPWYCDITCNPSDCAACENEGVTLTVTVTGGTAPFSYEWSTDETTQSITVDASGDYSVTVTDANGCTATCEEYVEIYDSPDCDITCDPEDCAACEGDDVTLTVGVTGGTAPFSYEWSTGETTQSITVDATDTYSVTVTDANGCTAFCEEYVEIIELPDCTIYCDPDCEGVCEGEVITLSVDEEDGYEYLWSPSGETTSSIEVTQTDTYCVTVTDTATGCSDECCQYVEFEECYCYTDETAWVYWNTLGDRVYAKNMVTRGNNWGWYAYPVTLTELEAGITGEFWAGAGQNDFTKGALIGHVTLQVVDGVVEVTYEPLGDVDCEVDDEDWHIWVSNANIDTSPGFSAWLDIGDPVSLTNENEIYIAVHNGGASCDTCEEGCTYIGTCDEYVE